MKYVVEIEYTITQSCEVDADNEEMAEEAALNQPGSLNWLEYDYEHFEYDIVKCKAAG